MCGVRYTRQGVRKVFAPPGQVLAETRASRGATEARSTWASERARVRLREPRGHPARINADCVCPSRTKSYQG